MINYSGFRFTYKFELPKILFWISTFIKMFPKAMSMSCLMVKLTSGGAISITNGYRRDSCTKFVMLWIQNSWKVIISDRTADAKTHTKKKHAYFPRLLDMARQWQLYWRADTDAQLIGASEKVKTLPQIKFSLSSSGLERLPHIAVPRVASCQIRSVLSRIFNARPAAKAHS